MEQSLVPGWSVAVVIGDAGTSFAVLRDGSNVVVIDLHPMKSMAVQILAGSMACVCHIVIPDLKVANVYGFLQCVTLSSLYIYFRSARRFGAAGSSPDFSRVFHDMALLGLCRELSFNVLYSRTQANCNPPTPMLDL